MYPKCISTFPRLLLTILCLLPLASFAETDSSLWQQAQLAYQNSEYEDSERLYKTWISDSAESGIHSSEAYYNLALAQWRSEKPSESVFHLLKSIEYRQNPAAVFEGLGTVSRIENYLGTTEPLSSNSWFLVFHFLSVDLFFLSLFAGGWCFVLGIVAKFALKKHLYLNQGAVILGVSLWLVAGACFLSRRYYPDFGVLAGDSPIVEVYGSLDRLEKVVELPAGTLVSLGKQSDLAVEVLYPISGWIRSDEVLRATPKRL